uniref:F5/8 type C domain-containing protein n=1 Tax=Macrostomum lignano TaxID=282301 RepID=A0A1I8GUP4_9PLAT
HADVDSVCNYCADMYSLPLDFPGDESFHHAFIDPVSDWLSLYLPHTYALTGLLIRGGYRRFDSLHGMVTSFQVFYSADRNSEKLVPFTDLHDGSTVSFDGPKVYVETARVNFQRSILAKLVQVKVTGSCGRRQLKIDLVGYPNEPAEIFSDAIAHLEGTSTLSVTFSSFYHLSRISVNRTTSSLLSFYITYVEVDGEPSATLQVQGDIWMFETRALQANFEFPILLAPIELKIHFTNGSLQQHEVTFLGKQSDPCPPGFVPMGDTCLHLSPVLALRDSARRVCRSFVWAGTRGDLLMPKDASVLSYLAVWVDYLIHVGIVRSGSVWQWLDGTPVPSSHWKLGQPGDVYGLWSTSQAALVAAADGEKQMFACQLAQAQQGSGNSRTLQLGHVAFADERPSYGGSFTSACVAHGSPSTSRSKQLLYNRLHLMDESLGRFSISHTQSSSTAIFACSVTSDLLSGNADSSIRSVSVVTANKDCLKPLLGQDGLAQTSSFPFSASYFDAESSHLGSGMRLRANCLIAQGDKENYVYPVNVTAYGRVCLSTASTGNKRDYKNYCISTTLTEAPFCYVDVSNTKQSCILHNCLHNYSPWSASSRMSHNIAYFKTIYFNGQRLQNLSRTNQGFLRVMTGSLAPAVGSQLHSLVVDFKSLHFINGVDLIAAGLQPGLRLYVGNSWQASLGDVTYADWPQCGAAEVPQLSTDYSIACVTGSRPYRFLALIRRRELGSLNITALMVYGKECE